MMLLLEIPSSDLCVHVPNSLPGSIDLYLNPLPYADPLVCYYVLRFLLGYHPGISTTFFHTLPEPWCLLHTYGKEVFHNSCHLIKPQDERKPKSFYRCNILPCHNARGNIELEGISSCFVAVAVLDGKNEVCFACPWVNRSIKM